MKAATFQGVGEVKVIDVPKPSIHGPDEALLKVTLGAICGSDLHAYHGRIPMVAGELLGHEFVGVVQEVGPAVRRFKPGDRVVVSFYTACGYCALCPKGWFNECVNTASFRFGPPPRGLPGGQSAYVVVSPARHSLY